ncbi:ANK1 [Symbiodinium sp. CCMP2592]|nr:ANK1 [Symbiodinium sp. CCMP2592]
MLRIRAVSGESLMEIDVGSFLQTLPAGMSPVRALKKHLHSMLGVSRFRQRLVYLGDDTILDDDHALRAGEIQLLLLNFCQASDNQTWALRDAARRGLTSEVENLLQGPQNPNQGSPLFVASEHGHLEVTRLLLEARADMDKAMQSGETPLYIATQNEQLEVVRLLLEANANTDKAEETGETPLYVAALSGQVETVRLLLEAHADKDKEKKVVRLLLEARADMNKAPHPAHPPLHIAAQNGHAEIADLLRCHLRQPRVSQIFLRTEDIAMWILRKDRAEGLGILGMPRFPLKVEEYHAEGEPKALADIGLPLDEGQPGDQYQVQLQVKGRFRSVTWERLDTRNVQRNGLPRTMGRYFIAGSWNDWRPEEMMLEDEAVGRFTIKASLPKGKQRFQILRNRDWRQLAGWPRTADGS